MFTNKLRSSSLTDIFGCVERNKLTICIWHDNSADVKRTFAMNVGPLIIANLLITSGASVSITLLF